MSVAEASTLPRASVRGAVILVLLEAGLIISWSAGFVGMRFALDYAPVWLVLFWRTLARRAAPPALRIDHRTAPAPRPCSAARAVRRDDDVGLSCALLARYCPRRANRSCGADLRPVADGGGASVLAGARPRLERAPMAGVRPRNVRGTDCIGSFAIDRACSALGVCPAAARYALRGCCDAPAEA